jgi:NAD(P)-dependent dehydrogenase (short-subunit alcohol dehydrogenase family)
MSGRFTDKVALVTGGNSGIGPATAKAFAREGARVAITGRSEATLKAAQQDLGPDALAIKADMSQVPEITAAMDQIKMKFGGIDALFDNAGIGTFVPFEAVTEEFFDETIATNLKGAFFTVQKATPLLSRGAAVVLNASINAHMGMPGSSVYGMGLPEEQTRQLKERITEQVPLKRFGHPDEIAAAVLYLSSSESAFVVGTELVIDGGMIQL